MSARVDDDGFDDGVETDDSDNRPDGRWLAGESDGADSPEKYQTAKDRFLAWVEGQSRKRQFESLVKALTGRITKADDVSEILHHERGHYTGSKSESGGLITSAENQSSLSKMHNSKPQLKGSKQRTGTSNSGQNRTN